MTRATFSVHNVEVDINARRVEVATITYNGRYYAALGSDVDKVNKRVSGYVRMTDPRGSLNSKPRGVLTTFDGREIGKLHEVSRWKTPRSWGSTSMHSYRVTIDGEHYHGRGSGDGMLLRLRAMKGGHHAS